MRSYSRNCQSWSEFKVSQTFSTTCSKAEINSRDKDNTINLVLNFPYICPLFLENVSGLAINIW